MRENVTTRNFPVYELAQQPSDQRRSKHLFSPGPLDKPCRSRIYEFHGSSFRPSGQSRVRHRTERSPMARQTQVLFGQHDFAKLVVSGDITLADSASQFASVAVTSVILAASDSDSGRLDLGHLRKPRHGLEGNSFAPSV